jgi:hypothetical protein
LDKESRLDPHALWQGLGWPLLRIVFFISIGLLVANVIENLRWTRYMARLATPLVRAGRLHDISGASFSMAFFSGVAANTMLSEAHEKGRLTSRELVISNLFNALPTYFLHLPTIFFITYPFLGNYAFVYVGLTLGSALLRTAGIVALGHFILPPRPDSCVTCELGEEGKRSLRQILTATRRRFISRLKRILALTVPIYTAVYFFKEYGAFDAVETFMSQHLGFLSWLHPEAFSIVVMHLAAEFTAGLATAAALLESGQIPAKEVILALLVGNILSSPMRAFRHQFPYYAGIFRPAMAMRLIAASQTMRAGSVALVTLAYHVAA